MTDRETITELLAGGLAALEWAFTEARRRVAEWEPAPCPPLPRRYGFEAGSGLLDPT